jgi:hypothetical protein
LGQTGNSSIGSYKGGLGHVGVGDGLGTSYRPDQPEELDIKWETQEQWNVGLDLRIPQQP